MDRSSQGASSYTVTQVCFRYRHHHSEPDGRNATWALNDLSFELPAGQILGIIGPNGSGKTSLLKLLARVVRPERGAVRLFGRDLGRMRQDEVARMVALVPQESQQVFPFTIAEMVLMGRFPHRSQSVGIIGWEREEDFRLAEQAMKEMDVAHLADRSVHEVSGGERQRAALAAILVGRPPILLLDEPTAGVDVELRQGLWKFISRLNREGHTVVLTTHYLEEAQAMCNRVAMLRGGKVVALDTMKSLIRRISGS
ncbi:MAG: hypothetical protein C4294_13965, partial [Nitrospiraceae bacterium]